MKARGVNGRCIVRWAGAAVLTASVGCTGDFLRHDVVDALHDPQRVIELHEDALVLAGGRRVPLPDLPQVPRESALLKNLVQRGVEVDPHDGRVHGLWPVWPRCGNDPVRVHITRVDVAHVMAFVADTSNDGGSQYLEHSGDGWSEVSQSWYERWLRRTGRDTQK